MKAKLAHKSIFDKYPNLKTLRLKLSELKKENFSEKSYDGVSMIFDSYFPNFIFPEGVYKKESFNRFKFYRVRMNLDPGAEDLDLIQTYSYPLPQFCRNNGRANLKSRSVFYCSNHAITAIFESKPKSGETGYLSIWGGKSDRQMKASIILPRYLREENNWLNASKKFYSFIETYSKKTFNRKSNQFNEFVEFIANLFVEESFPYSLTSYISHSLLYEGNSKDFIVYPSFENDSYSCNFAIHPNVVDKYMTFEKVLRFTISEVNEEGFSMTTGAVGEIKNNNIKWRQASKDEMEVALYPMEL